MALFARGWFWEGNFTTEGWISFSRANLRTREGLFDCSQGARCKSVCFFRHYDCTGAFLLRFLYTGRYISPSLFGKVFVLYIFYILQARGRFYHYACGEDEALFERFTLGDAGKLVHAVFDLIENLSLFLGEG